MRPASTGCSVKKKNAAMSGRMEKAGKLPPARIAKKKCFCGHCSSREKRRTMAAIELVFIPLDPKVACLNPRCKNYAQGGLTRVFYCPVCRGFFCGGCMKVDPSGDGSYVFCPFCLIKLFSPFRRKKEAR